MECLKTFKNFKIKYTIKITDALRGFDMFWITGGTELIHSLVAWIWPAAGLFLAHQFEHVAWNGFVFYDLIFALFIFMMGVSVPFSITKRKERGDSKQAIYKHILIRTVILLGIGFIYNNPLNWNWNQLRLFGVLIRIGLCYFFVSLVAMISKSRMQWGIIGIILVSLLVNYAFLSQFQGLVQGCGPRKAIWQDILIEPFLAQQAFAVMDMEIVRAF